VNVSRGLVEKAQRRVYESLREFKSVEYIAFVLTDVLREDEPEQAYLPEEEKEIKERLRRLGYIE
jgi:hypothetical protein